MKTLLLALICTLVLNCYAQNVNIPDDYFKAYLVGNNLVNTNGDAEIQVSEATAFTGTLWCSSSNIADITGIEAFTALTTLYCANNQLTSIDVTQNSALTILHCQTNQLTSLDVSQNTALITVECFSNQLTSLDVSNNTVLNRLFCYSNQLSCLNVKNGNNSNFTFFTAESNPNLTCIEVDDVAWSNTNWTNIDPQTSFSTSCANPCALGVNELSSTHKQLIKIVDLTGRETPFKPNTPLIYIYSDGTTEKVFKMEK